MNKKERWFSSITLLFNALPICLIGLAQSFIQGPFKVDDMLTGNTQYEFDVWQLNYIGLFCIIPFVIVVAARFLRGRGFVGRNFNVMLIAALVMNITYLIGMCWIVVSTARRYDVTLVFTRFDYVSLVCTLVSIVFCALSNCLPDLPPNPVFGVKNKRTMEYSVVWNRVNSAAASALTYIFLVGAAISAYTRGVGAIFVLLAGIAIYYIWVALYTRYTYNKYVAEREEEKKAREILKAQNNDSDKQ